MLRSIALHRRYFPFKILLARPDVPELDSSVAAPPPQSSTSTSSPSIFSRKHLDPLMHRKLRHPGLHVGTSTSATDTPPARPPPIPAPAAPPVRTPVIHRRKLATYIRQADRPHPPPAPHSPAPPPEPPPPRTTEPTPPKSNPPAHLYRYPARPRSPHPTLPTTLAMLKFIDRRDPMSRPTPPPANARRPCSSPAHQDVEPRWLVKAAASPSSSPSSAATSPSACSSIKASGSWSCTPHAPPPPSHQCRRPSRARPLRPRRNRHPPAHRLVDPRLPRQLATAARPPSSCSAPATAPSPTTAAAPHHPPHPRRQHLRLRLPRLRPKRRHPPHPAEHDQDADSAWQLPHHLPLHPRPPDRPLRHRHRSLARNPTRRDPPRRPRHHPRLPPIPTSSPPSAKTPAAASSPSACSSTTASHSPSRSPPSTLPSSFSQPTPQARKSPRLPNRRRPKDHSRVHRSLRSSTTSRHSHRFLGPVLKSHPLSNHPSTHPSHTAQTLNLSLKGKPCMSKWLNNLQPWGALFLRLVLGASMVFHGYGRSSPTAH